MDSDREQGKIILINGASSAGKSTLARLLQQTLEVPFWHFSFDHLRDSNALPWSRILNRELDWPAMRPAVFDGFHRCLSVLAESGNNLIVDHIVETEEWLSDLFDLLSAFDVFVVGVHCPLSELERRERDRGDRGPGEARADFKIVHSFIEYDLEVDSTQPSEAIAAAVIDAWNTRNRPNAFHRMAARK